MPTSREKQLWARGYHVAPDNTLWWLCKDNKRITTFDAGDYPTAVAIALDLTKEEAAP